MLSAASSVILHNFLLLHVAGSFFFLGEKGAFFDDLSLVDASVHPGACLMPSLGGVLFARSASAGDHPFNFNVVPTKN